MNRDWGFDRRSIWVDNNCRANFAYGYGSYYPNDYGDNNNDNGPNAGLIVGGVVVAAGLIAVLANKDKAKKQSASGSTNQPTDVPQPPAKTGPAVLEADLSAIPANARPSMQVCLNSALQQVSATGGSKLRFDRMTKLEPGNGGWRINAQVTASYADGDTELPIYCRATPTQVIQLDFIS